MKVLKIIGWTLLVLIVLTVILIVAIGVFSSSNDDLEILAEENSPSTLKGHTIDLVSFPLTSEADEGALSDFLSANNRVQVSDFLLFQNVDENSDGFNQKAFLVERFDESNSWFSYTKKIPFSFFPIENMRFKIYSGSLTLSKYQATSAVKRLLPSVVDQSFSLSAFSPSAQVIAFKTEDNIDLFLINLDNIQTPETETAQKAFLDYLKTDLIDNLPTDAYVIISGNWNYRLPGILDEQDNEKAIPLDWTHSGWQWIYDQSSSTYGMLLSDNIQIEEIEFFDGFKQNPFRIKLSLK